MNDSNQSTEIGELSKALSVAQGQLQAVPRNAENPFFKSSYADLAAIIAAARSILAAHGLSIVQFGLPTDNGKVALATQLNHISGQWVRGVMMAKPVKDDPQAMGSAVTYLRRYGWQAMLGLVQEGEDDDGNTASDKGSDKGRVTSDKPDVGGLLTKAGHDAILRAKTPPAASATATPTETPEQNKTRFLALFRPYRDAAREVFIQQGFILPTEGIDAIENRKIDSLSKAQVEALVQEVRQESLRRQENAPILTEGDAPLPTDLQDPARFAVDPPHPDNEIWRQLIVPFGKNRGVKLGDLAKGALKFYVNEWSPKAREYNGRMYDPNEADVAFYKALKPHAPEIIQRYGFDVEDERD